MQVMQGIDYIVCCVFHAKYYYIIRTHLIATTDLHLRGGILVQDLVLSIFHCFPFQLLV